MIIKQANFKKSVLTYFDLLGQDEVALTKALAYVFSMNSKALFTFLHAIGIKTKNTATNFKQVSIEIEKPKGKGRTDIEILLKNKFHVIIEAKVKDNKVTEQRYKYLSAFSDSTKTNILCLISNQMDSNIETRKEAKIVNISWSDIILLFEKEFFTEKNKKEDDEIVNKFMRFAMKYYKINEQKEILIQDLSDKTEIQRFKEYKLYRRNVTFGTPLYFAPYFTKNSNKNEGFGISYLSKIIGIITLNPSDVQQFTDDILNFASDNKELMQLWINGIKLGNENKVFTYYLLDDPLKIEPKLFKDHKNSKNWLNSQISQNRCVSFHEFTKRLMEAKNNS